MKKSKQAGKYILSDFISASVAWLLFNILRYEVFAIDEGADSLLDYLQYPGVLGGQVVIPLFWLVLYYFSGYYNKPFGKSRLTELFSTFITVLIGTVFVFFALLLDDIPRSIDIYYKLFFGMFGLQFFITYIPRLLITQSGMRKIKNREWAMKVLIIGAGGKAVRIAHDLYRLGYDICGFVSEDERTPVKADRNQVLGTVEDIPVLMEKENVDEIVLAVESKNNKALLGILYSLYRYKRPIKVLADRFNMLSKIQLRTIRGIPLVDVTDNNFSPAEQNIKLFLDKVCSVVALLLLSPLFAYIAWRVKKDSPGPVFFRQERIGRGRGTYCVDRGCDRIQLGPSVPHGAKDFDVAGRLWGCRGDCRYIQSSDCWGGVCGGSAVVGPDDDVGTSFAYHFGDGCDCFLYFYGYGSNVSVFPDRSVCDRAYSLCAVTRCFLWFGVSLFYQSHEPGRGDVPELE